MSPVELIDGPFLMRHEHLAGVLVEFRKMRAALSLSRLWQHGQSVAACQFVRPIYSWFTEGFATPDLHEAKVLCEILSRG